MKKSIITILSVFAIIIAFTSCKKDYTCVCYDNASNVVSKQTYNNVTEKTAKDKCSKMSIGQNNVGGWCRINNDI